MIKEYKQSCYESASLIPNWKNMDKNDLCRKYVELVESNDDRADNYLAAIIYKFWNITESNYNKQAYKKATEGDCIDWTITGILYALKHHVWDDPDNSLFNDPKGPEKAINVCIYSTKINFYQKIKHYKDKIDYESLSLEQLLENSSDSYYMPVTDADTIVSNFVVDLIKKSFYNKEYIKAFMLDIIINNNVFDENLESDGIYIKFNDKKLRHILKDIDDTYCYRFSKSYSVDFDSVKECAHYITDLTHDKLKEKVTTILNFLKHDKQILEHVLR